MGHARFTEPLSFRALALTTAFLASGVPACSIVDDEPPTGGVGGTSGGGPNDCELLLEEVKAVCLPGMHFESMVQGGGGSIVLVDDPGAAVGVGPDAWLVQVGAAADYVASYHLEGPTCTAACGWCAPGESICHQASTRAAPRLAA